jgi:RHS repeat-associated protein
MKDVSGTAPLEDRFTYYGADARIRAADYRYVSSGQGFLSPEKWVFEEYRYDALGRRVWVRAYRNCAGFSGPSLSTSEYLQCSTSTLRRTIWNGEEELIEIQVPGDTLQTQQTLEGDDQQWRLPRDSYNNDPNPLFGRVVYTSGLQLDQPIAVTRYRYTDYFTGTTYTDFPPTTYSLYWSPIGRMALATCVDGKTNCAGGSTYMRFEYPQALFAYDRQKFFPFEFQGTLILDKEDGVRTFYRRGRVYDPASGRFTQEDPIGLAGGLNLYGFVSGDPVNLSDPFGLCPLSKTICQWWARYRAELADQDRRLQQACAHDPNMCVQEVDMGPFDASPAGVEEEVLSIASKFDNIMKELKSFNHFSTARLEKTGRLITGFQHGKELEYFANGLKNSAIRLKRMLGDARLSAEARVEIQALLSKVSRLRDQILETLR